jgi:hypothetical protein
MTGPHMPRSTGPGFGYSQPSANPSSPFYAYNIADTHINRLTNKDAFEGMLKEHNAASQKNIFQRIGYGFREMLHNSFGALIPAFRMKEKGYIVDEKLLPQEWNW